MDILRLQSYGGGDRIANVLRDLGGCPDFARSPEVMGEAVLRLHGSMRQHRCFVCGLKVAALRVAEVTGALQRHTFIVGRLAQDIEDSGGVQFSVGAFVPGNLKRLPALQRRKYGVGGDRDGGVSYRSEEHT